MGWKKLIFGEKMPDKNDPKYRKQYEKEVDAGRRTARLLGIDKAAASVQRFAIRFPRFFLVSVFGVVIFCLGYNIYRIATVANMPREMTTATERQEGLLKTIIRRTFLTSATRCALDVKSSQSSLKQRRILLK